MTLTTCPAIILAFFMSNVFNNMRGNRIVLSRPVWAPLVNHSDLSKDTFIRVHVEKPARGKEEEREGIERKIKREKKSRRKGKEKTRKGLGEEKRRERRGGHTHLPRFRSPLLLPPLLLFCGEPRARTRPFALPLLPRGAPAARRQGLCRLCRWTAARAAAARLSRGE